VAIAYGPLLDALRGVRWPARRPVPSGLPGLHRSRQRGTAGDFTEHRAYRQGDDPRRLDWRLLARSDRPYVRLTDEWTQVATWFVLDASASMHFPDPPAAGRASKWEVACAVTVGLASVAHAAGDPVAVLVRDARGTTALPPRARRGTVSQVMRLLDGIVAGGDGDVATGLAPVPRSARVVIVTDLLHDVDALLREGAWRAASGAVVECVHVVAAEEVDPPAGVHLARDPEGVVGRAGASAAASLRPLHPAAIASYRAAFDAFRHAMAQRWRAAGAGYIEARTDAPVASLVRAIAAGVPHAVAAVR
jgi:uncharacterized protein (DUF58 family)